MVSHNEWEINLEMEKKTFQMKVQNFQETVLFCSKENKIKIINEEKM